MLSKAKSDGRRPLKTILRDTSDPQSRFWETDCPGGRMQLPAIMVKNPTANVVRVEAMHSGPRENTLWRGQYDTEQPAFLAPEFILLEWPPGGTIKVPIEHLPAVVTFMCFHDDCHGRRLQCRDFGHRAQWTKVGGCAPFVDVIFGDSEPEAPIQMHPALVAPPPRRPLSDVDARLIARAGGGK